MHICVYVYVHVYTVLLRLVNFLYSGGLPCSLSVYPLYVFHYIYVSTRKGGKLPIASFCVWTRAGTNRNCLVTYFSENTSRTNDYQIRLNFLRCDLYLKRVKEGGVIIFARVYAEYVLVCDVMRIACCELGAFHYQSMMHCLIIGVLGCKYTYVHVVYCLSTAACLPYQFFPSLTSMCLLFIHVYTCVFGCVFIHMCMYLLVYTLFFPLP